MSHIFEQNSDIVCALVDLNEGCAEDAIFDMLLSSGTARNWSYQVFWATADKSSKIIALCRTLSISGRVKILVDIPEGLVESRRGQAAAAGFCNFCVNTGSAYAMIYF